MNAFRIMGLDPEITRKGGVLVCLNPDAPEEDAVLLEAHVDTLGISPGRMPSFSTSSRLATSSSMTTSIDLYSRLAV